MTPYTSHSGDWLAGRLLEHDPTVQIFVEEIWKGSTEANGYRGNALLRRWWSFTVSKRGVPLGEFDVSDREIRTTKPSALIGHYTELIGEWLAQKGW